MHAACKEKSRKRKMTQKTLQEKWRGGGKTCWQTNKAVDRIQRSLSFSPVLRIRDLHQVGADAQDLGQACTELRLRDLVRAPRGVERGRVHVRPPCSHRDRHMDLA